MWPRSCIPLAGRVTIGTVFLVSSLFYISPFISGLGILLNMAGTASSQANSQRIFITSQTPIHSYLKANTDSQMEWNEMSQNITQKQIKEGREGGISWSMLLWAKTLLLCSINDCRFITENERHWRLLWQPLPHSTPWPQKRNSPDSYWNESLKCDEDAEV